MKKHEIIEDALVKMGGAGSGHHGHAGVPGKRGGSAPSGGGGAVADARSGYQIMEELKTTFKKGQPIFKGEWQKRKDPGRSIWETTQAGVDYQITIGSDTQYKIEHHSRIPAGTRYSKSISMHVFPTKGMSYMQMLKNITARGEGPDTDAKMARAEATLVKTMDKIFGIKVGFWH